MTARCEFAHFQPEVCGARASWLVAVGSRKTDAQRSCGRHLNLTCDVLFWAEQRTDATLTITRIPQGATS